MAFISGRIANEAPQVIQNWNLDHIWENKQASMQDYEEWLTSKGRTAVTYAEQLKEKFHGLEAKSFYLHRIREDGYREYHYQA